MTTIIKMYLTLQESGTIFLINRNKWRLCGSRIIENTIRYTGSPQWLPCGMLNRKICQIFPNRAQPQVRDDHIHYGRFLLRCSVRRLAMPSMGRELKTASFCVELQEKTMMKCPNCNHESSVTQKFCANCGTRLLQMPENDVPVMSNGQLLGVLSLVTGIISLFVFSIVFGPAAIILGVLALNKRNNLGWTGIILGGFVVLITGIAFIIALAQ